MIEKVNLRQVLVIAGIGLAVCFVFRGCGKSTTISRLQNDVNCTMGTIKAESSIVGVEIERSQVASDNAAEAIRRTQSEVSGSREAVSNLNAGITKLQAILAECEKLARESKAIIERVDNAN